MAAEIVVGTEQRCIDIYLESIHCGLALDLERSLTVY